MGKVQRAKWQKAEGAKGFLAKWPQGKRAKWENDIKSKC
jgi:hypothetical protein